MAASSVEHPRLLPAVLAPEPGGGARGGGSVHRTTRDWVVDTACFLLAIAFGLLGMATELDKGTLSGSLLLADLGLGLLACLALWVRRRWPVQLAVGAIPLVAFSTMAGGASLIMLFTVAVHRRWVVAAAVGAAQLAVTPVYFMVHPEEDVPAWVMTALVLGITLAVVAWGMFVRARRQLVLSLRDRAARAESEQQLRVEQARQAERARIAREMHDVLAHRISLLSLHAGALEFRGEELSPEEVARAAGVIRASAHEALGDLRTVIGVLRDGPDGTTPERPQPTLADLPSLLAESRAAGMRVAADCRIALDAVPDAVGRNALRIVQEGLTNARKHAPGAAVSVRVDGAPGAGVRVEVRNPTSVLAAGPPEIPGAGTGLVGVAERVALAGGRLEHGPTGDGEFRLDAWLPWPA